MLGVGSIVVRCSLLRNRGGDSGGLKDSTGSGEGGNGIVGIEYSFGKAYEVLEAEVFFLCREDNNL